MTRSEVTKILGDPEFVEDLRDVPGIIDDGNRVYPGLLYDGSFYIFLTIDEGSIIYDVLIENTQEYCKTLNEAEEILAKYAKEACGR